MRNHKNFITAFVDYAFSKFSPPQFYPWTALSVLASAIERKAWFYNDGNTIYPNLSVMIVAEAAIGKNSVVNKGMTLLNKMDSIVKLPPQCTEAKIYQILNNHDGVSQTFVYEGETEKHASASWYAPEATATLKPLHTGGDFKTTINSLLDCEEVLGRGAKIDGKKVPIIENVCVNFIGCCTFSHLPKIFGDDGIEGGFGSRQIIVAHKGIHDREFRWNPAPKKEEKLKINALIDDLIHIQDTIVGQFNADKSFIDAYIPYCNAFDYKRQRMKDKRKASYLGRKTDHLVKIAMLLSAAERDDRVLTAEHWETSVKLLDKVHENLDDVLHAMYPRKEERLNTKEQFESYLRKLSRKHKDEPVYIDITDTNKFAYDTGANQKEVDEIVLQMATLGKLQSEGKGRYKVNIALD